jgi:hypothetical protein
MLYGAPATQCASSVQGLSDPFEDGPSKPRRPQATLRMAVESRHFASLLRGSCLCNGNGRDVLKKYKVVLQK